MKKLFLSLLVAALVLSVACSGRSCRRPRPEESSQESAAESEAESREESNEESEAESSVPFYHSDDETYGIDTPYGELRFPVKWEDLATVRTEGDSVTFFGQTEAGQQKLFTLHFGEAEGFLLGYLTVDGSEVPLYIESFSFDRDSMSEEEYFNCCAMSEDINVIISHLYEERGLHNEKKQESVPQESRQEDSKPAESRVEESSMESGSESVPFYHSEGDMFVIDTPFAELKYPLEWEERLVLSREEGTPYKLHFAAKTASGNIPLFALNFGAGEGYLLGSLPQDAGRIPLYIDSYDIDQSRLSARDYEDCCAMFEAVNDTIFFLIEDCGLVLGDNGSTQDEEVLTAIETALAVLRFPAKWDGKYTVIKTEGSRYQVSFSANTTAGKRQLFDLFFGAGDGYLLGYIDALDTRVPVYIQSYGFPQDAFAKEEFDMLCAMQEDVNVIIENLTKEYNLSDVPAPDTDDDATFTIDTKYAKLEYPQKWENRVDINVTDSGTKVSFAMRSSAGKLPLFDLVFGSGDGFLLGLLPDGNAKVELWIVSYDVDRSKLSLSEFEEFCAMQEDVNVIISKLVDNYGLEF